LWDKEFHSQENFLTSSSSVPLQEIQQNQQTRQLTPQDADDLAHTAGRLLETIKDEQNPKFQNSQFMGLMKQLRDRMVIVEGNEMVENDGSTSSAAGWTTDFEVDMKGKGRAFDTNTSNAKQVSTMAAYRALGQNNDPLSVVGVESVVAHKFLIVVVQGNLDAQDSMIQRENANDAYFRQENEDYRRWNDLHTEGALQGVSTNQTYPWDRLQSDWDEFEATSTGIKAIEIYQFQANNPYLLGDSSRTRHHTMHSNDRQSSYEVFFSAISRRLEY
jgi:peroxin-5